MFRHWIASNTSGCAQFPKNIIHPKLISQNIRCNEFLPEFTVPSGFLWVHPAKCVAFESINAIGTSQIHTDALLKKRGLATLIYILSGEGEFFSGATKGRLAPGCILAVDSLYPLSLIFSQGATGFCIFSENADTLHKDLGHCLNLDCNSIPADTKNEILTLFSQCKITLAADIHTASAQLFTLYMHICRVHTLQRPSASEIPLVDNAIAIMNSDFSVLEGIDALAGRLGVSKNHLIRTFSDSQGISPGRYLQGIRMDYAKLLLVHRDYAIGTIANMLGYSESNYFCKVFKKAVGISPGSYRENFLQQGNIKNQSDAKKLDTFENAAYL